MNRVAHRLIRSLLLVAVFALAICSAGAAKEISFLAVGYSAEQLKFVQEQVIPAFKAKYGVDVAVITATWDTRMERIMVLTAGGTPPDVVATGFYSPYEEGSLRMLEPLNRYIDGWKHKAHFSKPLLNSLSWEGQVLVIPQNLDFRGIGYNKLLFEEAGFDPEKPPQSWDELVRYAQRLTRIDGNRVMVQGFQCTNTAAGAAQQFFWFMRQAGLPEVDPVNLKSNLNQPQALAALQVLSELYDAGANGLPASGGGFERGGIAMRYLAPLVMPSMVKYDPQIMERTGLFAPRQTPDSTPVSHAFVNGLAILSASKNKDMAWNFIAFLSEDDYSIEFQRIGWFFSGRLDLMQRMETVLPGIHLWYNILPYLQTTMVPPPRNVSQQELGNAILQVYKKQMAPGAALEQAHALWTRLLDEWKATFKK